MSRELVGGREAVKMIKDETSPEETKSDRERQETTVAESAPDTVAEVVQSWLRED